MPAGLAALAAGRYAMDALRHRRDGRRGFVLSDRPEIGSSDFMRTAESLTQAPIARGNRIELLINGDRIFPAMLAAIREARESINLLTYVYWRGHIAVQVAEALCEQARGGVEVRVLLDAFGALQMEDGLFERLAEAGVQVVRFRPLRRLHAARRMNHRTHRKILVVDGRIGMTGGVGIADEWTGDAQDPDHWRDTHVRVTGPVVRGLQGAFAENWCEATGEVLAGARHLPELTPHDDGVPMQVIRSNAGVGDTNVEVLNYLAIACARRSIDLTSAYFAPRRAFIDALVDAARRDVRVRIIVPGPHNDKVVVRAAGRSLAGRLIEAGVEVWEYQPTMLHAKSLCIDGVWSAVGSANFDNRSFQLNEESILCVTDAAFAERLTRAAADDLAMSERVTLTDLSAPRIRAAGLAARLLHREL